MVQAVSAAIPADLSQLTNTPGFITASQAPVQTVAGRNGTVVLSYTDISGLSTVAHSGAYTDLSNKPSLATVATSGSYTDLSNKPTLATVAGTGSYTDLSNQPTIPAIPVQASWTETNTNNLDYIQNKPSLATVATSGSYSDLSNKPTLATVAGTGSYTDLSNKPTVPGVPSYHAGPAGSTTYDLDYTYLTNACLTALDGLWKLDYQFGRQD